MQNFVNDSPSLFIQTGADKSQLFGMNFARNIKTHFVMRLTGGCQLMEESDAVGLANLQEALSGKKVGEEAQGEEVSQHPKFAGFCLFGGTRILRKDNPNVSVPGITEVPPAISRDCHDAVMLGVIAKAGHMRYTPYGLVVHSENNSEYATVVHPTQTSTVLLQPSADSLASWDDEAKECINICDALRQLQWQGLLTVYNGGAVTEREIQRWAKLGQRDPFWRVLLINGSGRKADEYANDEEFLEEHPTVHVCNNTVDSMRSKLAELGAII
jgi:hypothetical protein